MQSKMIFGALLVDISQKVRKTSRFWEKIHLPTSKILRYIYQSADPPPPPPPPNTPD